MKFSCYSPRAGKVQRLPDGTVMLDVVDESGNAVTLLFDSLEALVMLAGEMIARAAAQQTRPIEGPHGQTGIQKVEVLYLA